MSTSRPSQAGVQLLLQVFEFEGALRAWLCRCTSDPVHVPDLLHETYARIMTSDAAPPPGARSLRVFALGIAREVVLDELQRRPDAVLRVAPVEPAVPEDRETAHGGAQDDSWTTDDEQRLRRLVGIVRRMPRRTREIFTLRKVYGQSHEQIAAALRLPQRTVEKHLIRAARCCVLAEDVPSGAPRLAPAWLRRLLWPAAAAGDVPLTTSVQQEHPKGS